jgi:hypothetical protein
MGKAGVLRSQALTGVALRSKLVAVNGEMPEPLDDEEVGHIADSAERY